MDQSNENYANDALHMFDENTPKALRNQTDINNLPMTSTK